MEIRREMWMGAAGALAFVGAVVWMIPPTTPLAPLGTPIRPHVAGAAAVGEVPVASAVAPAAYPSDTPGDSTPVTHDAAQPTRLAAADPPAPPRWRDASPDDAEDQGDGEDQAAPPPGQAFAMGYRWAQANDIDDRRDCRRWRGPAEVGCLAYLHASDSGDTDEDGDVAQAPQ